MKPIRTVRSRVLASTAIAAVMSAAVSTVGAGPAHGDVIFMRTGTSITDDYALAEIWGFDWNRRSVRPSGAVWDRCGADGEGDGAGAYTRARVRFGNGTWSGWSAWEGDSSGCDNAGITWSHYFHFPERTITAVELQLCERDDGIAVECTRRTFDNPNVG